MRLSRQQLADNEAKIRTAMTRLLSGDLPAGGKCDIKTLAATAGVDRTAFYGTRPYAHLRTEFEQRLSELLDVGERPDPRDAQTVRLKDEIARLKERLARSDATISELADFRGQALARLAAQHAEITRLRQEVRLAAGVRRLPVPPIQEQNLS
jgi:phosphoglycerate-specific signal transduction histidine kinase